MLQRIQITIVFIRRRGLVKLIFDEGSHASDMMFAGSNDVATNMDSSRCNDCFSARRESRGSENAEMRVRSPSNKIDEAGMGVQILDGMIRTLSAELTAELTPSSCSPFLAFRQEEDSL